MWMRTMFANVFGSGRTTKMTNHELTLVKRYLEGSLSVKVLNENDVRFQGYQEACKNVLRFIEGIESRR